MFKYLMLAMAVGKAAGLYNIYTKTYSYVDLGNQINLLNLGVVVNAEILSFGTTYYGGKNDKDATQFISYGVGMNNFINATMNFQVAGYWTWSPMISFMPLNLVPYSQVIGWQRPETGNFALWTYGGYSAQLLRVWTTFTEYAVSCGGSFYDVIMSVNGATLVPKYLYLCQPNPSWVNSYEDQYWNFDILATIMPDVAQYGWYSGTEWYDTIELIGTYDPLAYDNWKLMVDAKIAGEMKPKTDSGNTPPSI
jgi:hypothetical protein